MNKASFKVLLFGKDGRLGRELQRSLTGLGDIIALNAASRDFCGDLNDIQGIFDTVLSVAPDLIVNAAAWTDVDAAQTAPEVAHRVNARAPGAMALAAQRTGSWLVHFSTDYVFDGSGERPWTEGDVANPLNVYGLSKLEGERLIAAACERHLIFRTSWLYAESGDNFAMRILNLARSQDDLSVVNDQIGTPTSARWLAQMTSFAAKRALEPESGTPGGIYHLVPGGYTSRYDYACFILECALRAGIHLKADPAGMHAISSAQHLSRVRRPMNARLDTSRFRSVFAGPAFPAWQKGVASLLEGSQ